MNKPLMTAETLIRSRHSMHMEKVRAINEKQNRGEERPGIVSYDDDVASHTSIILELEHLADALHIELKERLYG